MQRLVLFDLDDTLVDRRPAFAAWARGFVAERRLGEAGERWLVAADQKWSGPRGGFFSLIRERFGLADSAEELWAEYRARMPDLVRCRPETLSGLASLKHAGWRVGIVTNGMPDNQLAKIERTGLVSYVDGCCVSGEVGVRKPDTRIFRLAAERCGADPERGGWMVGDNPDHDVAGGRAAGLRTIWVAGGRRWRSGKSADFEADDAVAAIAHLLTQARNEPFPLEVSQLDESHK